MARQNHGFLQKGIQKKKGDFQNRERSKSNTHNHQGKKLFTKPIKSAKFNGLAQGGAKVKVQNLHYDITEQAIQVSKFGI